MLTMHVFICASKALRFCLRRALCFMENKIRIYLAWKATYAPRASINYKLWLKYFVEVCGNKEIEDYTIHDIVKYQAWLENRYKSYSVNYAIVIIKNFFKFFKEQDCKCIQPSLIKIPKIASKSHRAISEEEFERIISIMPSSDFSTLRDIVMIRILWDTGVRVGELTDFDLSHINEQKHSAVIITKKNGKKRMIIWSKETHRLLLRYLSLRLKVRCLKGTPALFLGLNYSKEPGTRITRRSVERIVKHWVDRAGINERITPHSFRHGWAHKRRDQNAPLAFIQRGLGHVSPISTFIYQNYHDWEFEKSAKKYLKIA